jgi:hypothetical protein
MTDEGYYLKNEHFVESTVHRSFSFRKSGKNVISLVYADFGKVRIPFCPLKGTSDKEKIIEVRF